MNFSFLLHTLMSLLNISKALRAETFLFILKNKPSIQKKQIKPYEFEVEASRRRKADMFPGVGIAV